MPGGTGEMPRVTSSYKKRELLRPKRLEQARILVTLEKEFNSC